MKQPTEDQKPTEEKTPPPVRFIILSNTTTPDAAAAIPQADPDILRCVHIKNANPDTVRNLAPHIKVVTINNQSLTESIAALPGTVKFLYAYNTDATQNAHIPRHIETIGIFATTTANAAAAIPQANPGIQRIISINNATANTVKNLAPHLKIVAIDNQSLPDSIAALPKTVTQIYVLDCDPAQIALIPGHINIISLCSTTTAAAAAAIPQASPGVPRLINIDNATAAAVKNLAPHIESVYISEKTSADAIAALPKTVKFLYTPNLETIQNARVPQHIKIINLDEMDKEHEREGEPSTQTSQTDRQEQKNLLPSFSGNYNPMLVQKSQQQAHDQPISSPAPQEQAKSEDQKAGEGPGNF